LVVVGADGVCWGGGDGDEDDMVGDIAVMFVNI
jgi:hypothetical protein